MESIIFACQGGERNPFVKESEVKECIETYAEAIQNANIGYNDQNAIIDKCHNQCSYLQGYVNDAGASYRKCLLDCTLKSNLMPNISNQRILNPEVTSIPIDYQNISNPEVTSIPVSNQRNSEIKNEDISLFWYFLGFLFIIALIFIFKNLN